MRWAQALLLLALVGSLGCATLPVQRQRFQSVETPHFLVVSSLGDEGTRLLADQLELFRVGLEFAAGRALQPARVKPVVLAFDGRSLARDFMLYGAKGYFLPSLARPYVVLRAGEDLNGNGTDAQRSALARYLLRVGGLRQPLWLESGTADFVSTAEVKGQGVRVGVPRFDHVVALRDRTASSLADTLFATDLSTRADIGLRIFASQAWGLVHYYRVAQRGHAERPNPLDRYARELAAGTHDAQAFDVAFRSTPEDLAKVLNAYARGASMPRIVIRHGDAGPPRAERVDMSRSEVLSLLADLALALGRTDVSERFHGYALLVDAKSGRAAAGLAVAAARAGEATEAELRIAQALELGKQQAGVQRAVGEAYYELARAAGQAAERNLRAARGHLLRSREIDPSLPDTHALLASSYLLPGEDASLGLPHARRARVLMPASLEVDLLVGELLARGGRGAEATTLLRDVASRSETRETRQRALALLAELRGSGGSP